jgi:hypothetical protein
MTDAKEVGMRNPAEETTVNRQTKCNRSDGVVSITRSERQC